jgi:malate dehydrogenase (oxaloacetate-decarboxylating)(NADP+)
MDRQPTTMSRIAGVHPLNDAQANKGTAYTRDERLRLGIDGLLPPRVETLQQQAARVLENVREKPTALEKYRYLSALQTDNETLFYRFLVDHLEELLPIVYTPTVGLACQLWSRIYRQEHGLYVAWPHRHRIPELLDAAVGDERIDVVVVTDGERVLGLGDLGVGGMGIPIGKLSLYTAVGGIDPARTLPVMLDAGTDNEALLSDPLYLGWRHARVRDADYDELVDGFVEAITARFPDVVLQWEDLAQRNATAVLERHRDRVCSFNDDIQGTGAMGLAGLYVAGRMLGRRLTDQRILFVGAGEACLGIGGIVVAAMQREGLSEAEARGRCLFIDSSGVVVTGRTDLPVHKRPFAQDRAPAPDLPAAVDDFKPTVLIGACAQASMFTQPVLAAISRLNVRPIVFALSNPTSKAECTAEQAYAWTDGRAIFAAGNPFDPVTLGGRIHSPAQGNNSYIFPGVGLGLIVSGARRATDDMFFAAAHALADCVSDADLQQDRVFPVSARLREVAMAVAVAVAAVAHEQGVATRPRPDDLAAATASLMYSPQYGE